MEELYADARRAANSRNDCLELPRVRSFTKDTSYMIYKIKLLTARVP